MPRCIQAAFQLLFSISYWTQPHVITEACISKSPDTTKYKKHSLQLLSAVSSGCDYIIMYCALHTIYEWLRYKIYPLYFTV